LRLEVHLENWPTVDQTGRQLTENSTGSVLDARARPSTATHKLVPAYSPLAPHGCSSIRYFERP